MSIKKEEKQINTLTLNTADLKKWATLSKGGPFN